MLTIFLLITNHIFIILSTFLTYQLHILTYYPSTYKDEVIIAMIIIVSLLATTVTVAYAHIIANLLYHQQAPLQHLCAIAISLWIYKFVDAMPYYAYVYRYNSITYSEPQKVSVVLNQLFANKQHKANKQAPQCHYNAKLPIFEGILVQQSISVQ